MKNKEDVLNQVYMTAKDLKIIMPTVGIERCRKYIEEIQEEMKLKGFYIPECRNKLALTKLIKKRFGI